jgi:hypothetical protein
MTERFALGDLIDDRPQDGVFRVNRALFRDPALFAHEMRHVFEGGWVFIGLASQAENPNDYFTGFIGRVPIIVSRDGKGCCAASSMPARTRACGWCSASAAMRRATSAPIIAGRSTAPAPTATSSGRRMAATARASTMTITIWRRSRGSASIAASCSPA